ncbi:twin-arginine translocation signal domain-containing protein [Algoriphagus kandeliae]|uniref:Twin-arginine translocation signal domain-containing protein n=1 Tax=Algoriphagus kandeliae TaxID=2562278 RepID=A0A4Y9QUX2_9BACT|nr:TIM barrel protein [Algoriphagus kandeliae]TFV95910.1 twin-arginine translocation signal domain-containing protein [Algoriphagus kandeliae]
MKRRGFIKKAGLSGVLMGVSGGLAFPSPRDNNKADAFTMDFAPHFGMFRNHAPGGIIDELKFMADQGFRSFEDNGMLQRPVEIQEQIGKTLDELGMRMGVFVIDGGDNWKVSLATGKQEFLDNFLKTCRAAVDTAKRVNAKWMTVVPGYFERNLPLGIQTANVIEAMKRGAEIFEPHGLTMVMEPLSDNPDLFLRHADQTYMICQAVGSPSCKILYDIYHMQRNEGNLIATMEKTWEEIAYIQIGDNPGRKEPGTGEINYENVFNYIHQKGFKGILGMEHGNAQAGKEGELALIEAYRKVDVKV